TTAGTGLKAALKLSGWGGTVSSAAYAITAVAPAQINSTIAVDNTTYTAGGDIKVTVILRDAGNNPVNGAAASLTSGSVTIPNAAMKSGSWMDNGDGTYTGIYTATTAGTGLKAALKLSGWGGTVTSAAYAITAAVPAEANSAIAVDNTTYIAGSDIRVTVTLKDAGNNPVTGAAASLTSGSVTVPNAVLKSGSWTDNNDGTYVATYTANAAGTGLKATLQLSSWASSNVSPQYSIVAGPPVQANSSIITDLSAYIGGNNIKITVTLRDVAGNAVSGASSSLNTGTVVVPNATSTGNWADNGDGSYFATYISVNSAASGLIATLKLSDWNGSAESATYTTTPAVVKDLRVGRATYSKESGFPSTGFKGAEFEIELSNNNASYFSWTSDAPWVSVSNIGYVTFNGAGNSSKVTVTGIPKNGGDRVTFAFTLNSWFISGTNVTFAEASTYCSSQAGYSLPTVQQLNGSTSDSNGIPGVIGGLWSEWGDMTRFPGSEFFESEYWSSEQGIDGDGNPFVRFVNLVNGRSNRVYGSGTYEVVCRSSL
ncbi:Ig-like domain-containing protein, partial [Enterobacter bugandensis]|uniref:Ig-like domain-containing protein n=1 Tax=Enterobacter bugandensis TaxID=881260 RepID=UPI0021D106B2